MSACPDGFWCFQIKDLINTLVLVATIFAIYFGPIRAVKISQDNDARRQKREKERDILSNLMKTRRVVLDPLHVASLNLVELEFSDSAEVTSAYRNYIQNLAKKIREGMQQDEIEELLKERSARFFDLVHAIGKRLGYNFDKRDLHEFSYSPQGWANMDMEQQLIRRLMIEMLSGSRPLPVTQFAMSEVNKKFPPPPPQ